MQNRAIDSRFRNTIVCIDSYEEKVLYGRMYNPYIEGEIPFRSTIGFIEAMEGMLEQMNFPQAYEEKRTFARFSKEENEGYVVQNCPTERQGKLATFELKIFFRQNASWQGTLCWLEEKREESFRSALELFVLMNSALAGCSKGV